MWIIKAKSRNDDEESCVALNLENWTQFKSDIFTNTLKSEPIGRSLISSSVFEKKEHPESHLLAAIDSHFTYNGRFICADCGDDNLDQLFINTDLFSAASSISMEQNIDSIQDDTIPTHIPTKIFSRAAAARARLLATGFTKLSKIEPTILTSPTLYIENKSPPSIVFPPPPPPRKTSKHYSYTGGCTRKNLMTSEKNSRTISTFHEAAIPKIRLSKRNLKNGNYILPNLEKRGKGSVASMECIKENLDEDEENDLKAEHKGFDGGNSDCKITTRKVNFVDFVNSANGAVETIHTPNSESEEKELESMQREQRNQFKTFILLPPVRSNTLSPPSFKAATMKDDFEKDQLTCKLQRMRPPVHAIAETHKLKLASLKSSVSAVANKTLCLSKPFLQILPKHNVTSSSVRKNGDCSTVSPKTTSSFFPDRTQSVSNSVVQILSQGNNTSNSASNQYKDRGISSIIAPTKLSQPINLKFSSVTTSEKNQNKSVGSKLLYNSPSLTGIDPSFPLSQKNNCRLRPNFPKYLQRGMDNQCKQQSLNSETPNMPSIIVDCDNNNKSYRNSISKSLTSIRKTTLASSRIKSILLRRRYGQKSCLYSTSCKKDPQHLLACPSSPSTSTCQTVCEEYGQSFDEEP